MKPIEVTEKVCVVEQTVKRTYTYEDIEEIFGGDPDCLVMQMLKRIKSLENSNNLSHVWILDSENLPLEICVEDCLLVYTNEGWAFSFPRHNHSIHGDILLTDCYPSRERLLSSLLNDKVIQGYLPPTAPPPPPNEPSERGGGLYKREYNNYPREFISYEHPRLRSGELILPGMLVYGVNVNKDIVTLRVDETLDVPHLTIRATDCYSSKQDALNSIKPQPSDNLKSGDMTKGA